MADIEFDPTKSAANIAARGLSFELAAEFEWTTARVAQDLRRDYGEVRYVALGLIRGRAHVVVFTPRGANIRIISLRRANAREEASYGRYNG